MTAPDQTVLVDPEMCHKLARCVCDEYEKVAGELREGHRAALVMLIGAALHSAMSGALAALIEAQSGLRDECKPS